METKYCGVCERELPVSEFYKIKKSGRGLFYCCKECCKEKQKEYRSSPEVKLQKTAYQRKWRRENPEKNKEYNYKWRMAHPKRYWASGSIAQHRMRGCEIRITPKRLAEMARATPHCELCGVEMIWRDGRGLRPVSPTLDRVNNDNIISEDSIMIVCRRCNSSKQDRRLDEFVVYCKMIVDKFGEEARLP